MAGAHGLVPPTHGITRSLAAIQQGDPQAAEQVLSMADRTVYGDWAFARAWLYRALCSRDDEG
jgi:hypothetical protein